jgi:hypothetical protein
LDRIAGKDGPGVQKKLLPELRVRESCGFKLHGSRAADPGRLRVPE